MRKRIGYALENWSNNAIDYMDNHQIAFWIAGMILTAACEVSLYIIKGNSTAFSTVGDIVTNSIISLIVIPSVGWLWMLLFMIPLLIVKLIGFSIAEPKLALMKLIQIILCTLFVGFAVWGLTIFIRAII